MHYIVKDLCVVYLALLPSKIVRKYRVKVVYTKNVLRIVVLLILLGLLVAKALLYKSTHKGTIYSTNIV